MRERWAPMEGKGSREGQRQVAISQLALLDAFNNTPRCHASPPHPPTPAPVRIGGLVMRQWCIAVVLVYDIVWQGLAWVFV